MESLIKEGFFERLEALAREKALERFRQEFNLNVSKMQDWELYILCADNCLPTHYNPKEKFESILRKEQIKIVDNLKRIYDILTQEYPVIKDCVSYHNKESKEI